MTSNKKILIVDDEEDLLLTLKETFEYLGWTADIANNGLVALEKVKEYDFDVILCDIKMPMLDGVEFLKRVPSQKKYDTAIYMMTAYSSYNPEQIIAHGARKLIYKPLSIQNLINEITSGTTS